MTKTASFYREAEALERVRIKLAEAAKADCDEMEQDCPPSGGNGEFRFCCAAKEICEPNGNPPLNFTEFSSTLKHFKAGGLFERRASDAHRAYLLRSCIAEVSPKMEELDTEIVRLDEELDTVLENGGEGRAELMSAILADPLPRGKNKPIKRYYVEQSGKYSWYYTKTIERELSDILKRQGGRKLKAI